MCKDGIFIHNYFQIGTCAQPLHNVISKNTIFIRAGPRQTGIALDQPVQKFRCVFPHKADLLAHGVGNLWFFAFCCCHIFPLKCLFLLCETRVGPVSLSLSFPISLSFLFSIFLSLSFLFPFQSCFSLVSVFVFLILLIIICPSFSVSLSVPLSLSLFLCPSFSVSLSLSLFLCLSFSLFLCLRPQ